MKPTNEIFNEFRNDFILRSDSVFFEKNMDSQK